MRPSVPVSGPEYFRVVSPDTANYIRSNRLIPPSTGKNEPYGSNEAVFLFERDKSLASFLVSTAEAYIGDHGRAYLLKFRFSGSVERDRSAFMWPSVAHLGPIGLADVSEFEMIELTPSNVREVIGNA